MDVETVTIELWKADALVLFDWLMNTDLNTIPQTHPSQKQALTDLLARLETDTTIAIEATHDAVAAAQAEVARDMGW